MNQEGNRKKSDTSGCGRTRRRKGRRACFCAGHGEGFCAGHGEGFWGPLTWDRHPTEGLEGTCRAEQAGRAEASLVEKAQAGLCRWRGPGEVRRSWGSGCPGPWAVVETLEGL